MAHGVCSSRHNEVDFDGVGREGLKMSLEDVKIAFPKELEELLEFKEYPEYVTIRGKQFLDRGDFTKVGAIVRSLGGEYISLGKQSHFKVPRQTVQPPPTPKPEVNIDIIPLLLDVERDLEKSRQAIRRALDLIEKVKT